MINEGISKFFLWRDCAIYLGKSFENIMHRHHAVQCCISLSGEMKIAYQGVKHWQSCRAAIIGSNVAHHIDNQNGSLCIIYLEKNSNDYKAILDYHCIQQSCQIKKQPLLLHDSISDELINELTLALVSKQNILQANKLRLNCISAFNGFISRNHPANPKISKILKYLHQDPAYMFSGRNLAEQVCLSESRMQHLFKQQVGIPIRRYILWLRLRHVIESGLSGTSLTVAAHTAGFADSAHFSRTFKSMFGIAPSLVLNSRANLQSLFCD